MCSCKMKSILVIIIQLIMQYFIIDLVNIKFSNVARRNNKFNGNFATIRKRRFLIAKNLLIHNIIKTKYHYKVMQMVY